MTRLKTGIPKISVSFWFFAAAALFAATDAGASAMYLALPALVHELGHGLALAACGVEVRAVRFTAFGVEIEKARGFNRSLARDLAVSLAGVAANFILALTLHLTAFPSMRTMLFISANLAVAIFNLLPVGSLDGGEAMRILSDYFFRPRLAYVISRIFSFAALVPLFAASIFLLLLPRRNFTLLIVCVYLLADIIKNSD